MAVYSADRVHRLRIVLRIVLAIAVLLALFAAWVLTSGEDDARRFGIFSIVVAAVLIGAAVATLRLLPEAGRAARTWAAVTGGLVLLSGVLMVGTVLAFLLPLLGLGLLFLALIPDELDGQTR